MFRTKFYPFFIVFIDAVFINLIIISTFSIRFFGNIPSRNIKAYTNVWHLFTIVYLLIFYLQGLYDFDEDDDFISIFLKIFSSVTLGGICIIALTFISREFAFPRTVFLLAWLLMCFIFFVWREVIHDRLISSLPSKRVILIGTESAAVTVQQYLTLSRKPRFQLLKRIDNYKNAEDEIYRLYKNNEIDGIIIDREISENQKITTTDVMNFYLNYPNLTIFVVPGIYDVVIGTLHHKVIGDIPLVELPRKPIASRFLLVKRFFDIFISLLCLTLLIPVWIITALSIKLTSKGPIFYLQDRVGKNDKIFNIIKFRTMIASAEECTGPVLCSDDDPRITKVGKLLRKLKIDEAPQILNVLKGDMSLVGPRPERTIFVQEFEKVVPGYSERKKILPGITGMAQINGHYGTTPETKLKYDLIYIYNYHPFLDFKIFYLTLQYMLREWIYRESKIR